MLALADRLKVTKPIKDLQELGLTAEETASKLMLKSPSGLDVVKAVRGEAIAVKVERPPVQEPKEPEGELAVPPAQVREEHPTFGIGEARSGTGGSTARSARNQRVRRNIMNLVVKFEHEKETKGTHRYKEVAEEGKPQVIGTLYIRKEALPTPVPPTIEVTVKS